MRLRQRFYVLEVVAGLRLTAAHFFRNMGRHIAHAFVRPSAWAVWRPMFRKK